MGSKGRKDEIKGSKEEDEKWRAALQEQMTSAHKVKILYRHGGNFIRKSNQLRYEGGKNHLVLVDQGINYSNLSIKVREKCKLTDITSIRYKYPSQDLDSLVSIEEDDDVSVMMKVFSQSNMVIQLFVSGAQNSSTLVATSEPVGHATKDLNGSNGIGVLSRRAIESNTGNVQNRQNDLHEMECNEMDNADSSPCLKVDRDANNIKEGQEFENQTAFRKALRNHAICSKFDYKRTTSGHGVFEARCDKSSCSWPITACKNPDKHTFEIKSLKGNHTCNMSKRSRSNKHVTEKWIADFVNNGELFVSNPNNIVHAIDEKYGIEVSYHKARRGKRLAEEDAGFEQSTAGRKTLSGKRLAEKDASYEQSTTGYAALSGKDAGFEQSIEGGLETVLKGIERTNPGSTAKLSRSSDKSLRIFVAYKASICGFLHGCRPVLILDVRKTEECAIVWMQAAAVDTNNERFPVASAFVQSKCIENWKWFCEELAHILEGKIAELIFLSDPKEGILEVFRDVFPDSHHRYPFRKILGFIFEKFKDWEITSLVRAAASALTQNVFDARMVALRDKSEAAWKFIKGIEPKHWAMSHCEGNYRLMGIRCYMLWEWEWEMRFSYCTEGLHGAQFLKDFHVSTMETFKLRSGTCWIQEPEILAVSFAEEECSCNDSVMGACPCKQAIAAIRQERENEEREWYTAAKYKETYLQQIYPLPDDTI